MRSLLSAKLAAGLSQFAGKTLKSFFCSASAPFCALGLDLAFLPLLRLLPLLPLLPLLRLLHTTYTVQSLPRHRPTRIISIHQHSSTFINIHHPIHPIHPVPSPTPRQSRRCCIAPTHGQPQLARTTRRAGPSRLLALRTRTRVRPMFGQSRLPQLFGPAENTRQARVCRLSWLPAVLQGAQICKVSTPPWSNSQGARATAAAALPQGDSLAPTCRQTHHRGPEECIAHPERLTAISMNERAVVCFRGGPVQ